MKPYYEADGITIYHGDCRAYLAEIEPVDVAVTDPPYGVIDSAIVLINGIAARIQEAIDAGGKPADFEALRAELDAKSTALAEAVAANQPPTP